MPVTVQEEPMTRDAAMTQLIDGLTAKAINEPSEHSAYLEHAEDKIADNEPVNGGDVLAAFVAGLNVGSVAVAKRWVERHPASALNYWAEGSTPPDF